MVTDSDVYVIQHAGERLLQSGKATMEIRSETAVEIAGPDILTGEDKTVYERLLAEAPEIAGDHTSSVQIAPLLRALSTFNAVVPSVDPV